jgi:DNA adenine methylase
VAVELFGGSAAVLLQKPRSRSEVFNDADEDVVRLFRVLRQRPLDLARALALTPFARAEYECLYTPTSDDLEAARRFVARSFMGQNSKGAFRRSGFDARNNDDHYISRVRSLAALPDELAAMAGRFAQVLIERADAVDLIARFDDRETFYYADPPYLDRRNYFRHRFGRHDHERLLDAAASARGMVAISGYSSELYDRTLRKWTRKSAPARVDGSAKRTEVLWLNPAAARAVAA